MSTKLKYVTLGDVSRELGEYPKEITDHLLELQLKRKSLLQDIVDCNDIIHETEELMRGIMDECGMTTPYYGVVVDREKQTYPNYIKLRPLPPLGEGHCLR
jgi:hypothetical protein